MPKRTISEAEREQRRAADRQFVQQAVEQLRSSDGWQRWLTTRRHFHTYSLRNQLLLAMQQPDATRVAGFKAWLALGYCVRRGEKALRIFAPCPPSNAKLQAWRDVGADPAQKPRTFFRLTAVFDTLSRDLLGVLSRDAVARLKTLDSQRREDRTAARVRSPRATSPCRRAAARSSPGDSVRPPRRGAVAAPMSAPVRGCVGGAQARAGHARHRGPDDAPAAAAPASWR